MVHYTYKEKKKLSQLDGSLYRNRLILQEKKKKYTHSTSYTQSMILDKNC